MSITTATATSAIELAIEAARIKHGLPATLDVTGMVNLVNHEDGCITATTPGGVPVLFIRHEDGKKYTDFFPRLTVVNQSGTTVIQTRQIKKEWAVDLDASVKHTEMRLGGEKLKAAFLKLGTDKPATGRESQELLLARGEALIERLRNQAAELCLEASDDPKVITQVTDEMFAASSEKLQSRITRMRASYAESIKPKK